jgi:hypothetical protein
MGKGAELQFRRCSGPSSQGRTATCFLAPSITGAFPSGKLGGCGDHADSNVGTLAADCSLPVPLAAFAAPTLAPSLAPGLHRPLAPGLATPLATRIAADCGGEGYGGSRRGGPRGGPDGGPGGDSFGSTGGASPTTLFPQIPPWHNRRRSVPRWGFQVIVILQIIICEIVIRYVNIARPGGVPRHLLVILIKEKQPPTVAVD